MSYSMNAVYRQLQISKQAVYQSKKRQHSLNSKWYDLQGKIDAIRKNHPGCGVEKMYHMLKPDFMGRDKFIDTCLDFGYRVKRKKNYRKTTRASKEYYPNLIQGLQITRPNEVWQSDITYFPINEEHYFGVFIIDVYSKKIVGYNIANHMLALANVQALKQALRRNKSPTYHHSDRGSQYASKIYTQLLEKNNVRISMGLIAQENAYAERFHRTIKEEYLDHWKPQSYTELRSCVNKALRNYNNTRLHNNIHRKTPINFEREWESSLHKPILTIFEYQ